MSELIKINLGTLKGVGAGLPVQGQAGAPTVTATVAGAGAVSATVVVRGSNDGLAWTALATLSPSGTDTAVASGKWSGDYAYLRADAGALSAGAVVTTLVAVDQTGAPSGDVVGGDVGGGLNANTDDSATISIQRQIKASAGRVTNIVCTSGTSIALVLYDNAAAAASGRQIYSGTLSAGDVVNPADAWFDQGCFAQFTGTASFVINTSESAQ